MGIPAIGFIMLFFCASVAGDFKSKCAVKTTSFLPLLTTAIPVVVIMTLLSKTQTRNCLWFCEKCGLVTPRCCFLKQMWVLVAFRKGKRGGWDWNESVSELLCFLSKINESSLSQFDLYVFLKSHSLVEKLVLTFSYSGIIDWPSQSY